LPALVEVEPVEQVGLKLLLGVVLSEARLVALTLSPRRGLAVDHLLDLARAAVAMASVHR